MLPLVLEELIDKYGEEGVFFKINQTAYWFNGKNVEYWCDLPKKASGVIGKKNKLYIRCVEDFAFSLRYKKENKWCEVLTYRLSKRHPLALFHYFGNNAVFLNDVMYKVDKEFSPEYKFDQFDPYKNYNQGYWNQELQCNKEVDGKDCWDREGMCYCECDKLDEFGCREPHIPICVGEDFKIAKYQNFIYVFNAIRGYKFDFVKKLKSWLKPPPINSEIHYIFFLNELFYLVYIVKNSHINVSIFNPVKDEWQNQMQTYEIRKQINKRKYI